jgi:phosphohistidine swiveling domain-containing protein
VEVPAQAWTLTSDRLEHVLEGTDATSLGVRSGADRWEPFVYGVVAAQGSVVTGMPVTDGIGAGRIVIVDDPAAAGNVDRAIIVARRPIPALASLLWRAAGLVTVAGSPAAHLFEVAMSVGVPTIINVDFTELFARGVDGMTEQPLVGAINGPAGRLWLQQEPQAQ